MPVSLNQAYPFTDSFQIHSADELVLTELVLENVLAEYEPEEIVALLSAFVFQEKTDVEPTLTANLERGVAKIVEISEKVNKIQTLHQVILSADDSNDFVSKPRFGMVEVVYEWARGMSFNRITDLTDVMEGTIVRVITRLDETCREVKNAARIIGDPTLFQKMGTCQELIKRYVLFPFSFSHVPYPRRRVEPWCLERVGPLFGSVMCWGALCVKFG
jgi:antiviral helicase SKI2